MPFQALLDSQTMQAQENRHLKMHTVMKGGAQVCAFCRCRSHQNSLAPPAQQLLLRGLTHCAHNSDSGSIVQKLLAHIFYAGNKLNAKLGTGYLVMGRCSYQRTRRGTERLACKERNLAVAHAVIFALKKLFTGLKVVMPSIRLLQA